MPQKIEAPSEKPSQTTKYGQTYGHERFSYPWVQAQAPKGEVLSTFNHNGSPAVWRYRYKESSVIYATNALHNADFIRTLLMTAGYHIYNTSSLPTVAKDQVVMVHAAAPGTYNLVLKNGKSITVAVDYASTLLVNAVTGEIIQK